MSKDVLRIDYKNLPHTLPVNFTLMMWLLLDRFQAPGWVWGVVGTVVVLAWIGTIALIWNSKSVDLTAVLQANVKK